MKLFNTYFQIDSTATTTSEKSVEVPVKNTQASETTEANDYDEAIYDDYEEETETVNVVTQIPGTNTTTERNSSAVSEKKPFFLIK